ncbi:MAG: toll/interleukin-1 receptor domain-containing protein [Thiolinea sp.]
MPEADAPMKKAFISYRRQDSAGYVRAMHDRLIRHFSPEQIFMDVDDIALGTDFVQELNENLQGCTVMLVVIGPQWTDIRNSGGERRLEHPQDFVRQEVAEALQRQLTVIPVLVNGAAMPSELELPEELQPLSRRQALELDNKYYESGMRELIAALERYLGKPEPSPLAAAMPATPAAGPSPPPASARRRWWPWLLGVPGIMAAAGAAVFWLQSPAVPPEVEPQPDQPAVTDHDSPASTTDPQLTPAGFDCGLARN